MNDGCTNDSKFDWKLHHETEVFLFKQINRFQIGNKLGFEIGRRIESETSTRFFDWIDYLKLPGGTVKNDALVEMGFNSVKDNSIDAEVYTNPNSVLFPILIGGGDFELAIKVEDLSLFKKVFSPRHRIKGEKYSPFREFTIKTDGNYRLKAIERRGYNGYSVEGSENIEPYVDALDFFFKRQRKFSDDVSGIKDLIEQVNSISRTLSKPRIADAFFRAERRYWLGRNAIARAQGHRQDAAGLGWANHDHHTFRSSRKSFRYLIRLFEEMDFKSREAFHAGGQAGWGAQIMEHPVANIVVFADLDISVKDRDTDFSHEELEDNGVLGTVGTWVGLHGESILQAGMHHVAARYNFERLASDMKKLGIGFMKPFSYFEFLKQQFSNGQQWTPKPEKLYKLYEKGSIKTTECNKFLQSGAIGSHLENIERTQGFKGFNQDNVSVIIRETDPRIQKRGA